MTSTAQRKEADIAVIGGGVVGAALALGLARCGAVVTVLDGGDDALCASGGNFALIWVQSKGLGMPEYALWSRRSAQDWHGLAALLQDEAGIDVAHSQPGGFTPCLSEAELEKRATAIQRLYRQPGLADFRYEVLDHAETRRRLPDISKHVAGAIYSPLDGHVNSLRLWRALRAAGARRGIDYRASHVVGSIRPRDGGFRIGFHSGFHRPGHWGEIDAGRVVLAAGLGNARLAPMVDLAAPLQPRKGQIIVTEKTGAFLHHPMASLRQTDEGGIMIGDSQEDCGFDTGVGQSVIAVMAERAVRTFARLAALHVVRSWSALRVMSPDGFPIYQQSHSHPGAFVVTCHSGVTLAANHVLTLAPAIFAGQLPESVARFSTRRFDVPPHV
ncbi:NAD(P)/FAD-dependent oxidoreductase [Verminephrobacter eiseniae]|uniref:NAD(P)/FAD-dependent oxidoreductase n=1 Tax=Verminephrobacter eiseniae TaxID=364317 RepID=UPI002238160F|nr:FAD-dependent oxidoreductase [Verminephrobacter eiseniae]MCW5233023.1 FAD-binding oxidoreductase [Verminephrobacter eiseniae]MCW5295421.1 FAD-binding oxidoreductase [Verminephrobacter eiseniae]MCW8185924.1 FAD-binding oxidoreductase [Verminephrobacter eiseniae]MCW8222982.1 FAD-binding oxidoreductase [Verminephrobacter eiseniae]MCW8233184.1 FAD-binding oxidoreductase [Verminephrobacter eiseniae]